MCLIIQSCTGVADSKRQRGKNKASIHSGGFFLYYKLCFLIRTDWLHTIPLSSYWKQVCVLVIAKV